MTGLSERKAAIVRTLFETAPDGVVGGLRKALADIGDDGLLTTVRDLVESEARDRHLRDIIFAPIAPLCVAPAQPGVELSFPPTALASLWRGLKRLAPDEIQSAKADLAQEAGGTFNGALRRLCAVDGRATSAGPDARGSDGRGSL